MQGTTTDALMTVLAAAVWALLPTLVYFGVIG